MTTVLVKGYETHDIGVAKIILAEDSSGDRLPRKGLGWPRRGCEPLLPFKMDDLWIHELRTQPTETSAERFQNRGELNRSTLQEPNYRTLDIGPGPICACACMSHRR